MHPGWVHEIFDEVETVITLDEEGIDSAGRRRGIDANGIMWQDIYSPLTGGTGLVWMHGAGEVNHARACHYASRIIRGSPARMRDSLLILGTSPAENNQQYEAHLESIIRKPPDELSQQAHRRSQILLLSSPDEAESFRAQLESTHLQDSLAKTILEKRIAILRKGVV